MTGSARQATSSGRITGGWVRAATLPTAKGLSRGYDRKAVDEFLLQCANGVDWLNGLLIGAENELGRLTADGASTAGRSNGRVMITAGSGRRPGAMVARQKKARVRAAARVARARP